MYSEWWAASVLSYQFSKLFGRTFPGRSGVSGVSGCWELWIFSMVLAINRKASIMTEDVGPQWCSLPPELMRDILEKVEQQATSWSHRRAVVAAAGVCRTWRQMMK